VSVGSRECPGARRCPEGARCFAERARERAAEADVVIVNTHLYGAHIASGGAVLPPHEVVVFDEAHAVEETMTASLGVDVAPGRLTALQAMARTLVDEDEAKTVDLAAVATQLRDGLADRAGTRVLADRPATDDDELSSALELARTRVETVQALLRSGERTDADNTEQAARRTRALTAAGHLLDDLHRIAVRKPPEVAWVDGTARAPALRLSPIDVGPPLAELLWGSVTAVLTSATIPPSLPAQLGMPDPAVDVSDVGSPFDYRSHALLYVARHLPDPRRPGADEAVHEELATLIEAAGGRTLALFTSRRATEAAASTFAGRFPWRMLVQGELPKARLLEEFARDETSCLFATLGFWQGVDVPGRALSLVTLDRIPFGRPGDPLLDARRERAGDAAFATVDLPRAATLLAQGIGRLIRTSTDRGAVAVLDPRLATAGYRRVLLAGLPPMRRTVDHDEVVRFLEKIVADG
ncbi:MAG: ATP-dependent DNA helicase, partial [Acidimicrobiales bacterium]